MSPTVRYDLAPIDAACPACHGRGAARLFRVTADQAAGHFVRRAMDPDRHDRMRDEIVRLWGGPTCDVVRCDACSFAFAHPYVAGRDAFYGLFLATPAYPQDKFEYDRTAEALATICAARGAAAGSPKLLEIGAGDGAFLRRVVPSPIAREDVFCTEFSPAGAEKIRALGIECEMTDARGLAAGDPRHRGRYDVACLFQVLEHLDDLDGLWQALNALTKPSADLFIAVPNGPAIDFQEAHGGELDMPPNHVGRWNRKAFEAIAGRHGWTVQRLAVPGEGRWRTLRGLAYSRHMRARQVPGSWTDRSTRVNNRAVRRLCSIPIYLLWHLRSLPDALAANLADVGGTLWVHMRKR